MWGTYIYRKLLQTALQAKGECLRFLDQSARTRATECRSRMNSNQPELSLYFIAVYHCS